MKPNQKIPTRTFDYLSILQENYPKDHALNHCVKGKWIHYSTDDYVQNSRHIAYALLEKGYQPDDKIIAITANRPEWNFIDMGTTLARCVFVPVYTTLSEDECAYIINHSDARCIFVGNAKLYKQVQSAMQRVRRKIELIQIDDSDTVPCLKQVIELGKANAEKWSSVVDENIATVSPDDVASIVYTSGTTGRPKGVMLTHRNLTFDAHGHAIRHVFDDSKRILSFLPLCHVYERTMNYESHELGISIWYAEGLATIKRDLASSQADEFCAVPRVLDTFFNAFKDQEKELKGIAHCIYHAAIKFGLKYDNYNSNPIYRQTHHFFDKLVYSKWRQALGGKDLMFIVCGGASVQPDIVRLFSAANLIIQQGYGLTETSPVVAVNSPRDGINKFGTAGEILDNTEVSFAPDGEILVRGPHVMKGYYKDPEETARIIDTDGWLHTGDIGCLEEGKYLKITDRKKEIFKLSGGKFIVPQKLETRLKESPFVENCMVVGENQKHASAIIVINANRIRNWGLQHITTEITDQNILQLPEVLKMLNAEVATANKTLADYEAIKRPIFVTDDWSIANGMLSQTLKLKRKVIAEYYKQQIEEIYN